MAGGDQVPVVLAVAAALQEHLEGLAVGAQGFQVDAAGGGNLGGQFDRLDAYALARGLVEAQGLGATKAETTMKIVVPAALSGIVASFILALSRALGETMAVTLAAGSNPILTLNPLKGIQTMTAYMVSTSKGDLEVGTMKYWSIFAVGLVLFAFTFSMNLVARKLVAKFKLNYQ